MSTVGIVSQGYKDTAELFRLVNNSAILLKKHHFGLNNGQPVSESELSKAKSLLAVVVGKIIVRLGGKAGSIGNEENHVDIPPFLIRRIRESHKGNLDWHLEELEELEKALREQRELNGDGIEKLDELCAEIDAETTQLYRKLRRK